MKNKIYHYIILNKEFAAFTLISLLILPFGLCSKQPQVEAKAHSITPLESADTFIPKGHSLVPLEIANYETLDSLLGQYGVVDLFAVDQLQPEKSKKIASHVKILRAPRNPSHFAILVPHAEAQFILRHKGPFMASIQNPNSMNGTTFEKPLVKNKSRIIFE